MPVQQHRLNLGEYILMPVQISPASLYHSHLRIGEEMHRAPEEIPRRNKIRIEDRDDLPSGGQESVFERAGFVAMPVVPVNVLDRESSLAVSSHQVRREGMGFIGRIVQHLNLQQLPRIIDYGGF